MQELRKLSLSLFSQQTPGEHTLPKWGFKLRRVEKQESNKWGERNVKAGDEGSSGTLADSGLQGAPVWPQEEGGRLQENRTDGLLDRFAENCIKSLQESMESLSNKEQKNPYYEVQET